MTTASPEPLIGSGNCRWLELDDKGPTGPEKQAIIALGPDASTGLLGRPGGTAAEPLTFVEHPLIIVVSSMGSVFMDTLLVAAAAFVGFIVAYHTYGRFLARKIFQLDDSNEVPSQQLRDDVDYVPTRKEVIFGHHFTSIAGTGPIVGPAIAVFWGWLPALLWVVLGSIFIGAVHDFGALVVSLRNRGQTVGEVAGRLISPRARLLFLLILFFSLTIVLAIFGLVIAFIFAKYPESVLSVWVAMPVAILMGLYVHRRERICCCLRCWRWESSTPPSTGASTIGSRNSRRQSCRCLDSDPDGLLFHCLGASRLAAAATARLCE